MFLKLLNRVGLASCVLLIVACLSPWAFYADINETFTGFYSFHNQYGKPGKFLCVIAGISLLLMLLPKVWAKRTNLFLCGLAVGYAIKSYILFASCYNAYCPQKLWGIYLMLFSTLIMLVASIFPDVPYQGTRKKHVD